MEIQRSKEAEKCSAVLVDRHALKKITVSSGILVEKEHAGEQVRKDTPGSRRNSARNSVPKILGPSLGGFLWLTKFCRGKLGSRNVTSTWSNRTGYCVTTLVCPRKTITKRKRGNGKREKEEERGREEKKETVTDLEETRRNYVALRAYKSQVRI